MSIVVNDAVAMMDGPLVSARKTGMSMSVKSDITNECKRLPEPDCQSLEKNEDVKGKE
jgi:hypothetical protein